MKTTILNMVARATIGVVSTVVGMKVGKKVADSHSTEVAAAAASAATLSTFVVANEVCNNLQYLAKSSTEPVFDPTFDESTDYVEDVSTDNTMAQDDEADKPAEDEEDGEDGNEFPSLLSSDFSPSSDVGSSSNDEPTSDSSTTSDEFNTSTDEAAGNASDNADNDEVSEEDHWKTDPLKIKAAEFLKMTGGDPSIVGGINSTLLKECLDAMLTDSTLYKAKVCEDDDRTYLSGPWVDLIEEIAGVALVKPSGRCDWDEHEQLAKVSSGRYFVTPGEVDSFGWVTGCINTPVGIIVYG